MIAFTEIAKKHSRHWMTVNQDISLVQGILQQSYPSTLWHSCWFPCCLAKLTKLWDIYGTVVSVGPNCNNSLRHKMGAYLSTFVVSSDVEHQLCFNHPPNHMIEEQLSPTPLRTDHLHNLWLQRTTGRNDVNIGALLCHQLGEVKEQ